MLLLPLHRGQVLLGLSLLVSEGSRHCELVEIVDLVFHLPPVTVDLIDHLEVEVVRVLGVRAAVDLVISLVVIVGRVLDDLHPLTLLRRAHLRGRIYRVQECGSLPAEDALFGHVRGDVDRDSATHG